MAAKVYIQRAKHGKENPYFSMVRKVAQNKELTHAALGLLAELLSRADDWRLIPEQLRRPGTGHNKVYKLLNELIAANHITREILRDPETKRVTEVNYYVSEEPLYENHNPEKHDDAFHNGNTHSTDSTEEDAKSSKPSGFSDLAQPENGEVSTVVVELPSEQPNTDEKKQSVVTANALSVQDCVPGLQVWYENGKLPRAVAAIVRRKPRKRIPVAYMWNGELIQSTVEVKSLEKRKVDPEKPEEIDDWDWKQPTKPTGMKATERFQGIEKEVIRLFFGGSSMEGFRVGRICHRLFTEYETANGRYIQLFRAWYKKKYPDCELRSPDKFLGYYDEWYQGANPDAQPMQPRTKIIERDGVHYEVPVSEGENG